MRHIVKPRAVLFNAAWSWHPPCTLGSFDPFRRTPSSRAPIVPSQIALPVAKRRLHRVADCLGHP
ncbi:hypothetical protein CCHR01_14852 [Colletotrichum chrysophilum]|uniref:Uncharacterized protein n=1 Tax=Colletotrichum chrysophilum TaxID=1836956 RepID=A0AAD9A6Q9_9PEZI|nr:hypothetical protein CCHR01_14852 [Colletotrichum chrysophilum]